MNEAGLIDDLARMLIESVAAYPARAQGRDWWQAPLIATAIADERFDVLPKIAADDHLLPRDLLPTAKALVVFFVPFKESLLTANIGGEWAVR
ncbi:MAG: hypothetical protein KKC37_01775, partial [Proteobacteria bacterium]|nr:hypothetical protein [Pseudomonadota bacterium]